jgi:methylmalonyl-CoA mutase
MATSKLLQEFPPVSTQEWEEAIAPDLKGAEYGKRLIWKSDEGLALRPYYRAEDLAGIAHLDGAPGSFPYLRGAHARGGWRIREEIDAADPEEANRAARGAAATGAEEIAFRRAATLNASELGMLLAGLEGVPVHFEGAGEGLIRLLIERLGKEQTQSPVSTDWNPLGDVEFAAEVVRSAPPALRPFTIDGAVLEESGANAAEEIGFTLSAGVEFMAAIEERGMEADRAAASLGFSFAIGANYFFQIAKLRAFRMAWARVVESFGGTPEGARTNIHGRSSRWNKTIYDPHVNILRGTTEAMAAILGGADSVSVAPFDACYNTPDEASRRLARNTQILLKHEAMLGRVADPAGGSYCVEVLTDFLAREGWKTMQEMEAAGGYRKAEADGRIRQALERSLAARENDVALRRRVFVGTSRYANASERALKRIDLSRVNELRRGARIYEELRLRTERHRARGGKTPRVLLAEFGNARMRGARSNFAADLFACAGFEIVTRRFAGADAIAASDGDLIVLCSSDAEYAALVAELMPRLKALGRATPVIVAGNPEGAEELKAAGIADFVHLGSHPIEFLGKWQERLGIAE